MAVDVKLLHIVSDNNLIKGVHRFVLSPFRTLRRQKCTGFSKIVSEYDQEIPQSQNADNPVVPQERAAQPSRDTRKTK